MAPPPEYDKEPKAPDKSAVTIANDDSKLLHNIVNDQQTNSDHKPSNTAANTEVENNKQVVNLDDGQLRALLDEAMNYKCPKDLEGKSNLFKELLEEVEQQDDQASEAAARGVGAARAPRRSAGGGARSRHALHSNSLQDLVAALAAESAPRRPRHHAPAPAPVSTRAIQGGSLPSGVDTSFLLGEEGGGARYLATVRCVNPPPLGERRVSASDANGPDLDPPAARRSKPVFPMTYTARATLEIGSGSVCSGRAVTTTTASNQGDSAIPFSCITTPEVVASCNTTSSTPQSAVAVDPKPRSVISSSFNGLPLSRPCGAAPSDQQKSLDENGNAVQGFSSPVSGSGQHKKPRRKKSSKNETVIKSHQIDGYQGNKDLNEVLRFIESHAERPKHDKHKKRSAERRKDKDKPPRASSLEELSRTTLEELTAPAPAPPPEPEPAPPEPEPADFQTVTKRRAKRRPRPPAPGSNDSNDDLESAGSPPAAPPPPPPAASYADIARTRHNIPDLIESCNFYAEGEAPPPEPPRADDYPALGPRARHKPPPRAPRTDRAPPPPPQPAPAPDVVGERRPAVILLAAGGRARELDGVTFGFDVNETLLAAPARRPRCDLVRDALELDVKTPTAVTAVPAPPTAVPAGGAVPARGVAVGVGSCALRYVAPAPPPDTRVLHQLVDYVGSAWEDVVRCGAGKVRYFSE